MGMMINPHSFGGGGGLPPGIHFVGRTTHLVTESTSNQVISLTSLTGGIDTAPAVGDLILIGWARSAIGVDVTPTTPTGYTNIFDLWPNDTYEANLHGFYIIAGSGDLTSVTVGGAASGQALAVHVRVYRGVHQTTPLDVAVTTAQNINGGRPDPSAITPITSGAWIVVFGSGAEANMTTFVQGGDLTDFVTSQASTGADSTIGSGHKTDWTSGSFNPAAWTGGSTNGSASWAAATIALRPA